MIVFSLAFLLGVAAVQQLSELPGMAELILAAVIAAVLAYKRSRRLLGLTLGILWASLFALWRMSGLLPPDYQNTDISVTGYISSLPQPDKGRASFDFSVTEPAVHFPAKIRLNWYAAPQNLAAGQNWRLTVKLKPPHGLMNPGGFDYEAWLFANHIGATGYVRHKPEAQLLGEAIGIAEYFARWRQAISTRLDAALPDGQQLGLIKALTIGAQNAISQQQWQVFRATGTTHLVVISGSHISLIAGLVYLLARRGWAWLAILSISPQRAAAWLAWLAGIFYAGVAGYSIPTLRAIIMLSIALAAIAWQRNTSVWHILMLALLTVLIFDPPAVLSIGFWLSFTAVALLLYVSAGRLGRSGFWRETTIAQLATFLGLSPLLIVFFQQVSLISPLANWLAAPFVGVVAVPLALLAVLLLFIAPALAVPLLQLTDWPLQALWLLLAKLAALPLANLHFLPPPWYALPMAVVAVLLILAPRGFPARYLSLFLFLPLLAVNSDKPPPGSLRLTLLDVGQGLSAVIETAGHTLVFDTGAKFSDDSDRGDSVIIPFLKRRGIERIDALVVSHGDNDHSGGASTLKAEMPITDTLSSVAEWAEGQNKRYCRAGQSWIWEQVAFTVLAPPDSAFSKENDNSCVLKIQTGNQSVLLTGDIETAAEDWLVQNYGGQLYSTLLIAPHHGSKTSSSVEFLQQVRPDLILIPAGYLNRFHLPHQAVLGRYRQLALPWLNTAEQGAITVRMEGNGMQVGTERRQRRHYWSASVLGENE
ncbi:MAG: DNA internalization-related competence protein ComEC/Rec2 [Methylomonas sp.]|jgi:competence protein ComEC